MDTTTFKGPKVSIKEHFTGEWEVLDTQSGKLLYLVSSRERALEEYDKANDDVIFQKGE